MIELEWIALAVVVLASGSLVYFTLRLGISPMPSNRAQRDAILEAIGQTPGPIYELGAGWGTLAFALADRFPQAPVVGFELSWIPWLVSRLRQGLRPRKNLTLRRADYLRARLGEAKVLVSYLFPGGMQALAPKLEQEAAGASLVTHTFAVRGWTPERETTLADLYRTHVYVYRIAPASR